MGSPLAGAAGPRKASALTEAGPRCTATTRKRSVIGSVEGVARLVPAPAFKAGGAR